MNVNKAVLKFVKLGITTIIALIIVYFTVSISLTCFDFGYRVFTEPAMEAEPGTNVAVTIDASMDAQKIGKELESKGLVRDANLFAIQLKLSAYAEDIIPGTYILNTSMEPKEMMIMMSTPVETEEEDEEASETETESGTEDESGSEAESGTETKSGS